VCSSVLQCVADCNPKDEHSVALPEFVGDTLEWGTSHTHERDTSHVYKRVVVHIWNTHVAQQVNLLCEIKEEPEDNFLDMGWLQVVGSFKL